MLIIPTGLEKAIRNVKNLESEFKWGLAGYERKNGLAVWGVGNCLITLLEQAETTTEIAREVFRPFKTPGGFWRMGADDKAREGWDKLIEHLRRNGLAKPCPDLERVANETLKMWDYNPSERALGTARRTGKPMDVEQARAEIQAELAKLADRTLEQAKEEYFARFESADKPTVSLAATMRAQSQDGRAVPEPTAVHLPVLKPAVVTSNQSGGITAQNIIVQGDFHQNAPAEHSPQKKNALETVLKIIFGSLGFLAALVTILAYFKIFPF